MEKDAMRDEECGRGRTCIFLSFLAGGIIGAGIVLLAASKRGEGIKDRFGRLGDGARQKVEDYIEKMKDGVTSAMERGKDLLEQERTVIDKAIEAGREILEQQKSVIGGLADPGKKEK